MQRQKPLNSYWLVRLFAILFTALLSSAAFADAFEIKNIRVAKNGHVTRIVLDTSDIPSYKLFTLNNPGRVVIDLTDAKLATSVDQSIFNASFVEKVRHARRGKNKLRIVFDLNKAIVPKSFVLPPNEGALHRLVIDLKNTKGTTQLAKKSAPKKVAKKSTVKAEPKKVVKKPAAKKVAKAKPSPKAAPPKKVVKNKKPNRARNVIVAIDPGHGGKDPGATGYAGTREKDVVLQISKRLVRLINAEKGMKAVMTRDTDKFLTLRGRIKRARDKKADIFISIHADAVDDRRVRGSSVYVLSKNGASSEAAKILAQRQNQSDVIGGVKLEGKDKTLRKVLVDLSQSATINASVKLASSVKDELGKLGKTRKNIEHAGFAVLKSPDIPSILVETAFISNASEEKKLRSATHQQKLASSIFRGIRSYLADHAPENTIIAKQPKPDKHTIKYGETLSEIAVRYSVSLDSLRKTNALRSDKIKVGQKLIIPGV